MSREEDLKLHAELKRWKAIALYLADCQAATTGLDLDTKSVSLSRKNRHRSISKMAADMIEGIDDPPIRLFRHTDLDGEQERIVKRLRDLDKE